MKNWKSVFTGFIAGALCMVGTTALAAGVYVSAYVSGDITFNIDDQIVVAPSDQPVLNYNSRAYVPIRFVAEQLGCEVEWDVVKRQVVINTPEPEVQEVIKEVEVEVPVYIDKDEAPDGAKVYSKAPVTLKSSDYEIELIGATRRELEQSTKIFINIENKSESEQKIYLLPNTATLIADGEEYDLNLAAGDKDEWYTTWYNGVPYDEEYEGELYFDIVPEDTEQMTLTFTLRMEDVREGTVDKTIEFNFTDNF